MDIKTCGRADYPEMLKLLNRAFECREENWFERNVSMAVPFEAEASDEQIARHLIAVEGGAVIGCVGAYPAALITTAGEYEAYGIGQVACDKDFRGKGVMSALIKRAISEREADGERLGFLFGLRHRYRLFGFEMAGKKARFEISAKSVKTPAVFQIADDSDIPALMDAHVRMPARVKRDEGYWKRLLARENYAVYISGGAYIIVNMPSGTVAEAAGEPGAVIPLLGGYAKEGGFESVTAESCFIKGDPLFEALLDVCEDITAAPACLARNSGAFSPFSGGETFWIPKADEI